MRQNFQRSRTPDYQDVRRVLGPLAAPKLPYEPGGFPYRTKSQSKPSGETLAPLATYSAIPPQEISLLVRRSSRVTARQAHVLPTVVATHSSERTQSNLGRGSRKICTRIRHGNSGPLVKRHGGTRTEESPDLSYHRSEASRSSTDCKASLTRWYSM
jgi:hypothetical protein